MYNEVIVLIKETKTVNEYGDAVKTTEEREVFAGLRSIGQSEFYQAEAVGMKPEIKFVLPDFMEYEGEQHLKYTPYPETEAKEYEIIRTYRTNNELELVCKRGVD